MQIEIFAICDAATNSSGKLNLLGTFDTILAEKFPCTHSHCSIAVRLRFEKKEEGKHNIIICFASENEPDNLPKVETSINVTLNEKLDSIATNMVINFQKIIFKKPGIYTIKMIYDNKIVSSIPLRLEQKEK